MNVSDLTIRVAADTAPLRQGLHEINSQVSKLDSVFEKSFQQMGQSFSRHFTTPAKGDVKTIGTILGGLVQSMENVILKGYVGTLKNQAAAQGGVGQIVSGVFSGNWITDLIKGVVGGKAAGGNVAGGAPVLVGERGPEMFIPFSGGKIVNNQQLVGSGGAINLHMTVVTPDVGGFRASQAQILSEAAQAMAKARRNL